MAYSQEVTRCRLSLSDRKSLQPSQRASVLKAEAPGQISSSLALDKRWANGHPPSGQDCLSLSSSNLDLGWRGKGEAGRGKERQLSCEGSLLGLTFIYALPDRPSGLAFLLILYVDPLIPEILRLS